jgi:CO/xanthine dehydrogenase FAD-binding subunit
LPETFLGPGESAIDHHRALLTRMRFRPTLAREASAFKRIMRPQGVALPMIAMAARLQLGEDDTITSIRIALGPAGPVPYLAESAMDLLTGAPAGAKQFEAAAEAVLAAATLRTSRYRATREYRAAMIRSHLPLVLASAAERARSGRPLAAGAPP